MAKTSTSIKHIQINKASTVISVALAAAAFVTVFSLIASKAMLEQRAYNSRVIKEKELAVKTLEENVKAVDKLVISYKEFIGRPENIIGGQSAGTGERDGDNAKLTLDSLPGSYDFPAVTSSLEKILTQKNFTINQITGTDDEVAQASKDSANPEVVEIPYTFVVTGGYDPMHDLILTLERSIRPLQITKLKFAAGGKDVQLTIEGKTFYQSEKVFKINEKVVK